MLLRNIQSCDLLSWCLYRGRGGGDRFLLRTSVSYSTFVSARAGWRGFSQMWTYVDKGGKGVKNHWKCADILYGWSFMRADYDMAKTDVEKCKACREKLKILLKHPYRQKAPSKKTPALTKSMNMGIWSVGTGNQLFIWGS